MTKRIPISTVEITVGNTNYLLSFTLGLLIAAESKIIMYGRLSNIDIFCHVVGTF